MHNFEYFSEGLKVIFVVLLAVGIPCGLTTLFGCRLINDLGQYPSRSAKVQMNMALPLLATMVFSYGFIILSYYIISE